MIDMNIKVDSIQQKAPSKDTTVPKDVMAQKPDNSFSEHLDNSVNAKKAPEKTVKTHTAVAKTTKSPEETTQTDDEKLKLAVAVADKLKGVVNDQSIVSIINSLLNAINNGLDVSDPNKLVIPVDFSANEVGYLNNLLQQYGIADKIQLVTTTTAAKTMPMQSFQGIISNPEEMSTTIDNISNNIQENRNTEKPDTIVDMVSKKLTGTKENSLRASKVNGTKIQAGQNIRNNVILQAGTNLGKKGKITDITIPVKGMPLDAGTENIIPERTIKDTAKGLNAAIETFTNSLETNTGAAQTQPMVLNNTTLDKQIMAQVKQMIKPAGVVNIEDRNIITQIVKNAGIQLRNGTSEVKLNLDPPSLGSMQIKLSVEGNHIKATVVAESSLIKDVIESNLSQLKASLSNQGLKVDQFSVLVGNNSHQNRAWNNASGGFHGERGNDNEYAADEIEGGILTENLTKINNYNSTLNPSGVDVFI